jgi:hypothetical protein
MGKKLFSIFTTLLVMIVFVACSDNSHTQMGEYKAPVNPETITPKWVPLDSTHVDLVDKDGVPLVRFLEWRGFAEVKTQPTQYADATEPWQPGQQLIREQLPQQAETNFRFNHGINTVKTSVKFIVAESKVYDLGDGRKVVLTQGQELELYKPENLNLKGGEPATEVREGKPFYAETKVPYNLRYVETVIAKAVQPFVAEEGYVPSFERMEWKSWHFGPAVAEYANGKATVTCPDSLNAHEVWDDGSNRNWLRKTTTSRDIFSVTVSGTEVDDINAVIGKNLTVNGDKASVAEFSVTVTRTSKEIVEKNLPYTYNGKTINFIDSLHACGYKLKGGQVISKSQVRVDMVREGSTETVSFNLPVNITEKVRLVRTDSTFVHVNYVSTVTPNGTNLPVLSNHTVTFENVYSNGTKSVAGKVNYQWTNNYSISYDSNMMVDDLNSVLGRHTVNSNGSVTVAGYNFTVSFVNRVCDDIMYNGKNYKAYAPICKAKVVAITINQNSLVVEFQGDHDGDNSVIKATLPLTVTEKPHDPDFNGRIVWGGAVDSYNSVPNGVYEWHGCYLMFLVENNGVYTVNTRNINATSGWATYQISSNLAATASNDTPLAYVGPNGEDAIGYLKSYDQGSWHKIVYYNADGSADKIIQEICKTIKGNNGNECRNPLRGVWSNGKITVDGKTYTITGSQN